MSRYRFITPHRIGKWYPDLTTAQAHACQIGAGFLDRLTGRFVAYMGTVLEVAAPERMGDRTSPPAPDGCAAA